MAIDTTSPRTRRAILFGALGGTVAAVAAAMGRANPVVAANGDVVHVAHSYDSTSPTAINATLGSDAFVATSDSGVGVHGTSGTYIGVFGHSNSGTAVSGRSNNGNGVHGASESSSGVSGVTLSGNQPAILGNATNAGTGVHGYSGYYDAPPASPAKSGVYGYANQDETAVGVMGQSVIGIGLVGQAAKGRGGQFSGYAAQLQLLPSTAKTHPKAGATGDLFVDDNQRLWFCKGGTSWVQLA